MTQTTDLPFTHLPSQRTSDPIEGEYLLVETAQGLFDSRTMTMPPDGLLLGPDACHSVAVDRKRVWTVCGKPKVKGFSMRNGRVILPVCEHHANILGGCDQGVFARLEVLHMKHGLGTFVEVQPRRCNHPIVRPLEGEMTSSEREALERQIGEKDIHVCDMEAVTVLGRATSTGDVAVIPVCKRHTDAGPMEAWVVDALVQQRWTLRKLAPQMREWIGLVGRKYLALPTLQAKVDPTRWVRVDLDNGNLPVFLSFCGSLKLYLEEAGFRGGMAPPAAPAALAEILGQEVTKEIGRQEETTARQERHRNGSPELGAMPGIHEAVRALVDQAEVRVEPPPSPAPPSPEVAPTPTAPPVYLPDPAPMFRATSLVNEMAQTWGLLRIQWSWLQVSPERGGVLRNPTMQAHAAFEQALRQLSEVAAYFDQERSLFLQEERERQR